MTGAVSYARILQPLAQLLLRQFLQIKLRLVTGLLMRPLLQTTLAQGLPWMILTAGLSSIVI
jgi:hypothetical protein